MLKLANNFHCIGEEPKLLISVIVKDPLPIQYVPIALNSIQLAVIIEILLHPILYDF